jgi:hypothetical protein
MLFALDPRLVVYPTTADNYFAPKPGTMAPTQPVSLFLTDGFKEYKTAILSHFGQWMHPERRRDNSPRPKPRWMPCTI